MYENKSGNKTINKVFFTFFDVGILKVLKKIQKIKILKSFALILNKRSKIKWRSKGYVIKDFEKQSKI